MRICLLSAPSITYDGDDTDNRRSQRISETPPLGILTLAAVLERLSITPVIIHLNRLYREYLAQDCHYFILSDVLLEEHFRTARVASELG